MLLLAAIAVSCCSLSAVSRLVRSSVLCPRRGDSLHACPACMHATISGQLSFLIEPCFESYTPETQGSSMAARQAQWRGCRRREMHSMPYMLPYLLQLSQPDTAAGAVRLPDGGAPVQPPRLHSGHRLRQHRHPHVSWQIIRAVLLRSAAQAQMQLFQSRKCGCCTISFTSEKLCCRVESTCSQ